MDLTSWWAVHVPSATPKPVVDKLNVWFKEILLEPDTKEFLNKFGGDPFISTPEETTALKEVVEAKQLDWTSVAQALLMANELTFVD